MLLKINTWRQTLPRRISIIFVFIIYQSIIQKAIDVSQEAHREWERRSIKERSQIFLRAADLISGKYRMDLLATTMLGQVGDDVTWSGEGGGGGGGGQILSMSNTVRANNLQTL